MWGCYKCVDYLKRVFLPDLDLDDEELVIKNILRKFVFFIIFLIVTTVIALLILPPPALLYYLTNQLQTVIIHRKFTTENGKQINFEEIVTIDDFWSYLNIVLKNTMTSTKILDMNWVMGHGRMRQVRVGADSCYVPHTLTGIYAHCYPGYTPGKADINEMKDPSDDCKMKTGERAWKYSPYSTTFESPVFGKVAYYDAGGFIMDISDKNETMREQLDCLKEGKWVILGTRGVFVHFLVHNANLRWFVFIKLLFEFPPTGGIVTSSVFLPLKMIRYITKTDYVVLAFEILFILFIIYYTIEEILELFYYKWDFFKNIWNVVDLVIILIGYALIILNLYVFFTTRRLDWWNKTEHVCIERVIYTQRWFQNLVAIILFLIWMKLFKYFKYSRTLGQFGRILSSCAKEIFGFSVMFFIVFFAFALAGYLLFGDKVEGFSTFGRSLMTLLMTILGDFKYHEIEAGSPFMAPLFFITYTFFVFFMLFNIFLAIIIDAYLTIKGQIIHHSGELEMSDVLKRGARHCSTKMGKDLFRNRKELPGNNIIYSLRKILKLCKFSNLQIDALFTKYDVNEHIAIRESDIRTFIAKLKANIYQDACAPNKRAAITVEQYVCQRHKIDIIDKNIKILLSKLCTFRSCGRRNSCTHRTSHTKYRKCRRRKNIPNPTCYNTCA